FGLWCEAVPEAEEIRSIFNRSAIPPVHFGTRQRSAAPPRAAPRRRFGFVRRSTQLDQPARSTLPFGPSPSSPAQQRRSRTRPRVPRQGRGSWTSDTRRGL